MNFVIVGAGALGSIYAAYLARAGHEISLIARGERAAALVVATKTQAGVPQRLWTNFPLQAIPRPMRN